MHSDAKGFAAAVALFQFSRSNLSNGDIFADWIGLAGESGALGIRNFGQHLAKVRRIAGSISTWRGKVDLAALGSSVNEFSKGFPGADRIRNAIAHPEFYPNPNKDTSAHLRVNTPTAYIDSEHGSFQSTMIDDVFHISFEGEHLQCSISEESLQKLTRISKMAFDAFQPLDTLRNIRL